MPGSGRKWIVVLTGLAIVLLVAVLCVVELGRSQPPPSWAKANQASATLREIHEALERKLKETATIPKTHQELDDFTFAGSSLHRPQDYTWDVRSSDGVHVDSGTIVARGKGLPVLIYDISARKFWLEDADGRPFDNAPPRLRK